MDAKFVRERITGLRLRRGISEYQMSYDLGHSKGYINNITSGKALPSLAELLAICAYFSITPADFFDESNRAPALVDQAKEEMKSLSEADICLVLDLIRRLRKG